MRWLGGGRAHKAEVCAGCETNVLFRQRAPKPMHMMSLTGAKPGNGCGIIILCGRGAPMPMNTTLVTGASASGEPAAASAATSRRASTICARSHHITAW